MYFKSSLPVSNITFSQKNLFNLRLVEFTQVGSRTWRADHPFPSTELMAITLLGSLVSIPSHLLNVAWPAQNGPSALRTPQHTHTHTSLKLWKIAHHLLIHLASTSASYFYIPQLPTSSMWLCLVNPMLVLRTDLLALLPFLGSALASSDRHCYSFTLCAKQGRLHPLGPATEDSASSLLLSQPNTTLPRSIPDPEAKSQNCADIYPESDQVRNESSVHRTLQ